MPDLDLVVEGDHLERLARAGGISALAELIWNSLDAEATSVEIDIRPSTLAGQEGVGQIIVTDDGHGIPPDETESTFGHLGGSWKALAERSRHNRVLLHGRAGQGRFKALALGGVAEWHTIAEVDQAHVVTDLKILRTSIKRCSVEVRGETDESTGTRVTIQDPSKAAISLANLEQTRKKLTALFALRLMHDPSLEIKVNGEPLDPTAIQTHVESFELMVDGLTDKAPVTLDVVEWSIEIDRALHLCDSAGFSLHSVPPGIQAPTFNFTAYVRWEGFREHENVLSLGEMSSDVAPVIRAAQDRLRDHFRTRADHRDSEIIRRWKDEGAYPYEEGEGTPSSSQEAERQVFDLLALTINAASPAFSKSEGDSKKVTLRLLREAVERSPESVHRILGEVARLDADRLTELADLLENTQLSRIIGATRTVTDRLVFLDSLDMLLFEHTDEINERDHLHKILAHELWIFGENFDEAISERGLTNVLRSHIRILGREELVTEPVRREDGRLARVDLMLSAAVPGRGGRRAEHLVVELKAPDVTITSTEIAQVEDYATAILNDPRFHNDDTYWEFWLVGNQLDGTATRRAEQSDRRPGLIDHGPGHKVFLLSWSQVLEEHRRRLHFMREALEHEARDDASIAYLRRTHSKYLPPDVFGGSSDEAAE